MIGKTLLILLVLGVTLINVSEAQKLQVRDFKVSNGEKAVINEFPFLVSLQQADDNTAKTYSHNCGASIISSKYLLTAGHCFDGDSFPWIAVYGGNSVSDTQRKYVKVKTINVHPQYKETSGGIINDIAILELESEIPLDGKTAKTALLEIGSVSVGASSIVAGWGTTVENQPDPTDLMKVTVPVVDISKCNDLGLDASSPKQICAGDGKGHDSCQGDSGGPLFYKVPGSTNDYVVFGIVSFGPTGCGTQASATNRGIYTNVTSYLDYVQTYTTFGTRTSSAPFLGLPLVALMAIIAAIALIL